MQLPTNNGTYAVFFNGGNGGQTRETWHAIDLIDKTWWDGSVIVRKEWVEDLIRQGGGTLYEMEAVKTVILNGESVG